MDGWYFVVNVGKNISMPGSYGYCLHNLIWHKLINPIPLGILYTHPRCSMQYNMHGSYDRGVNVHFDFNISSVHDGSSGRCWCLRRSVTVFGKGYLASYIWSNYSDLTRTHPKYLISGKSRLVKYYSNLARLYGTIIVENGFGNVLYI